MVSERRRFLENRRPHARRLERGPMHEAPDHATPTAAAATAAVAASAPSAAAAPLAACAASSPNAAPAQGAACVAPAPDPAPAQNAACAASSPDAAAPEELFFPSRDGRTRIHALVWEPVPSSLHGGCPRGVVQIVHGMCEHVGRYDGFARFLAARGFAVCGEDHLGHGGSAADPRAFGDLPPREGKDILISDVDALRRLAQQRFGAEVPFFLFGHSMGSFIVRAYLARPLAAGLAGAVICGTGQQPRALSAAGNLLARAIGRARGTGHRSAFIDGLGAGAYGKRIPNARTPFDWLSTDPAVVDAYLSDERCGFMFTVGGYAALTDLTGEIADPACVARVPRDLPLLFIAGAEDPVGDDGKGVDAAVAALRAAGVERIDEILYPGMRHEVLNEPGRAQVMNDVAAWIEARLAASAAPCEPAQPHRRLPHQPQQRRQQPAAAPATAARQQPAAASASSPAKKGE